MSQQSQYRAEIDGLRAIAIVPVLFFHFGMPGLPGGFTGVDVFFVISGFLIGGVLWSELRSTGSIRLGHFFMRRIRRLAPAFYVVALVSFVAGWMILLPFEFREFSKELIAASVYLSNVYFYSGAGYFDVLGEQRVLLHTWSLAVEEQFYVVLPLLLIALSALARRAPRFLIGLLAILGLASLIACVIVTERAHSAAFYLFPFRAWELLAGVLLAVAGREAGLTWQGRPWLSWAGIGLIFAGFLILSPGEGFPGIGAVLPVLGAVLVITNGRDRNPVNQVLETPLFLFFGKISYSLYLWHWPVIVLATYYAGELGFAERSALMAVSILLAWLSLIFIETPTRRASFPTPALLGGYVLASAASLGLAAIVYLGDGLIWRFPSHVQTHIAATQDFRQNWSRCHTPTEGPFTRIEICPIGPQGDPKVLVWGDSHARAWKEGIEQLAVERDVPGVLIWRGGCPPLSGIAKDETANSQAEDEACTDQNNRVLDAAKSVDTLETVLLIGRWAYYANGGGVGRDAHNQVTLSATSELATVNTSDPLLAQAFDQTLTAFSNSGLETYVLRQPPEIANYHSLDVARALAHGHKSEREIATEIALVDLSDVLERQSRADQVLDARQGEFDILDVRSRICSEDACSALRQDGQSYYFDNNHITNSAAIAMRDVFNPVFDQVTP